MKNVYIFPGVPPLLEKSFEILCEVVSLFYNLPLKREVISKFESNFFFQELFGGAGLKFYKTDVYINESEVSIAEYLSTAAEEFPSVAFGSYPQFDNRFDFIGLLSSFQMYIFS